MRSLKGPCAASNANLPSEEVNRWVVRRGSLDKEQELTTQHHLQPLSYIKSREKLLTLEVVFISLKQPIVFEQPRAMAVAEDLPVSPGKEKRNDVNMPSVAKHEGLRETCHPENLSNLRAPNDCLPPLPPVLHLPFPPLCL